jgi:hypothetical protein
MCPVHWFVCVPGYCCGALLCVCCFGSFRSAARAVFRCDSVSVVFLFIVASFFVYLLFVCLSELSIPMLPVRVLDADKPFNFGCSDTESTKVSLIRCLRYRHDKSERSTGAANQSSGACCLSVYQAVGNALSCLSTNRSFPCSRW